MIISSSSCSSSRPYDDHQHDHIHHVIDDHVLTCVSHEQAWALTGLSGSNRCQELQSRSEEEDCEGDDDDGDDDDGDEGDDDDGDDDDLREDHRFVVVSLY